ncbi:MAG: CDP-alcohol phosphatidyltransferase family protein [Candidatus Omnitrophica bacterium]|nr:CDP-alcohol phosphatidyltransferase family protein [Candidatus Omnitrophota bacterium]
MSEKDEFIYKEKDKGKKELLSMLIYRPVATQIVLRFMKQCTFSPNLISMVSLLLGIAASLIFALGRYPVIAWGVVLLHLSYLFDVLDGQYARYKNSSSAYGAWFDPFVDIIKAACLLIGLAYGAYQITGDAHVFLWSAFAMTHSFLTMYILNTRDKVPGSSAFEVVVRPNIYIGYEISLYWIISLFVLCNLVYLGLIVLGSVGALSWVKCFISVRRNYFLHRRNEKLKER